MCKLGEVSSDAYVSEWERERRENQRQVSDVTGVNGPYLRKRAEEVEGGSDTKPLQFHILVCQTSAFLPNPFTESLIIPPCCSSSLCLIVSLADSLCYVCLSFVYLFVMFSLCLKWPQSLYLSLSQPYGSIQFKSIQFNSFSAKWQKLEGKCPTRILLVLLTNLFYFILLCKIYSQYHIYKYSLLATNVMVVDFFNFWLHDPFLFGDEICVWFLFFVSFETKNNSYIFNQLCKTCILSCPCIGFLWVMFLFNIYRSIHTVFKCYFSWVVWIHNDLHLYFIFFKLLFLVRGNFEVFI